MSEDNKTITNVLFSSLLPLVHLASEVSRPLKDLKRLVEIAYYQESRRRSMTQKDIAERLAISMGKAGLLSRQLKDHFAQTEDGHATSRRVLALLWAGPQSETRIAQFLEDVEPEEVHRAIERLVAEGLVEEVTGDRRVGRYQLKASQFRQGHLTWMAKIDGLNNFVRSVARLIAARFLQGDERAVVRVLDFRVRPQDLERLRGLYEEQVFPLALELDEAAGKATDSLPMNLAIYWVPGLDDPIEGES